MHISQLSRFTLDPVRETRLSGQSATVLTTVKSGGFAMLIRLCRTARGSSPGLDRPLLTSALLGGRAIGRRRDEEQAFSVPNKEQGREFGVL